MAPQHNPDFATLSEAALEELVEAAYEAIEKWCYHEGHCKACGIGPDCERGAKLRAVHDTTKSAALQAIRKASPSSPSPTPRRGRG